MFLGDGCAQKSGDWTCRGGLGKCSKSGSPTSGIECLIIWGGADAIWIEMKCITNVTHLNHPQTTLPLQSVEKLSSIQPVSGAKKVGDHLVSDVPFRVSWKTADLYPWRYPSITISCVPFLYKFASLFIYLLPQGETLLWAGAMILFITAHSEPGTVSAAEQGVNQCLQDGWLKTNEWLEHKETDLKKCFCVYFHLKS